MRHKNKAIFGVILVIIGIILLGRSLDIFYISFGELFRILLPVAFIIAGIWLILRRKKIEDNINLNIHIKTQSQKGYSSSSFSSSSQSEPDSFQTEDAGYSYNQAQSSQSPSMDEAGKLKYNKAFGDMYIDFNNVGIKNVEVSTFLGDLELRLHGGILAEGLNRIIISSFIGDIRIFAPKDMAIFTHCSNFVGDVDVMGKRSDGFGNNIDSQTENYASAVKKLYIACNSFIGDIKIYGM